MLNAGTSGSLWNNGMMEQWNIEYSESKMDDSLILFFDHCQPNKNRSHFVSRVFSVLQPSNIPGPDRF
jgi:hypothetical protein